jgi:hypothetical protein
MRTFKEDFVNSRLISGKSIGAGFRGRQVNLSIIAITTTKNITLFMSLAVKNTLTALANVISHAIESIGPWVPLNGVAKNVNNYNNEKKHSST